MPALDAPFGYTDEGQPLDVSLVMTDSPLVVEKSAQVIEAPTRQKPGIYEGEAIIRGTGSSELEDTDGHVFMKSALADIMDQSYDATDDSGLIVILNHDSRGLPGNLFGSIVDRPEWKVVQKASKDNAAIRIGSDVEFGNPAAVQTYEYMSGARGRPRKLGFSVGAVYKEVVPRMEGGRVKGVWVKHCEAVHWAVTTQPANRAAWIETVIKSVKFKGFLDQNSSVFDPENLHRIEEWRKLDDINGPILGEIASYLEDKYGVVCATKGRIF